MTRIFSYDGREFPDPDPKLAVEEVRQQLSQFFPELVNAETRETRRGEDTVYTFSKRIGTKGRGKGRNIVAILRGVPEKRLAVFDLAAQLTTGDGELNLDEAAAREPDIQLAIAEADAYARATQRAVQSLRQLMG